MKPTTKLRFIKRQVPVSSGSFDVCVQYQDVQVLQQYWCSYVNLGFGDVETAPGEWRDVELVDDAE